MSLGGVVTLVEPLTWRDFSRRVVVQVVMPVEAGEWPLLVEVGPRPMHPKWVQDDCYSPNREKLLERLREAVPDRIEIVGEVQPGVTGPALAMRAWPVQFWRDGRLYQHVTVRQLAEEAGLTTDPRPAIDQLAKLTLTVSEFEEVAREGTTAEEAAGGVRRFFVPVGTAARMPAPVRKMGERERRLEPTVEAAGETKLTLTTERGAVALPLVVYEPRGRHAPAREHRVLSWPTGEQLQAEVPEPILPGDLAFAAPLYRAAWDMFLKLVKDPGPTSGTPNAYLATGAHFNFFQFVWDSCFTTMASAYAHRVLPVKATLDAIYSRQFDGGYIHRQSDTRDALPAIFEPDFSPNPPLLSIAEWRLYQLMGDAARLERVYPLLVDYHVWLRTNRQLGDGTYWASGLSSGLDNAPTHGVAHPDLTAQMAHDAETLAAIAGVLGRNGERDQWLQEHEDTARALNRCLWHEAIGFYTPRLSDGTLNVNKVVTGFWPLWAGLVPAERAKILAAHAADESTFNRYHPLASTAADAAVYNPKGEYWRGSVWAPTNYVAIQGLARAGFGTLAKQLARRHLQVMYEVWQKTGALWENYAPDAAAPGSMAGSPYCWTALGPICLLMETLLGFEPEAGKRTLHWHLEENAGEDAVGVRKYALGNVLLTLERRGDVVRAHASAPTTLIVHQNGKARTVLLNASETRVQLGLKE